MEPTLAAFVRLSLPVSCAHVCMVLLQLTDLAVVGRLLGAEQLAAVCLVLVVVNLTLEPASFITANALTTLCGDSLSSQNVAQIGVSVRAAVLFCLLLTLPIGGLLLGTPALLSLLTAYPNDVLAHAAEYAPAYVLVVGPALLQSVLLGFLRAHGRLRSTALVCALALVINAVNLAAAVASVPTFGVRASALCTAAVRCLLFLSLAALHRPLLVAQGVWPRAPGAPSQHAAVLAAVLSVFRLYAASLLPATLRFGVAQLLTLLALRLGSSPVEAACIFLSALILDVGYSLCVGIQQANLKLTARYMSGQRAASARRAMRLAGLLLVLLAAAVGLACWMLRSTLGALFCDDPVVARGLEALSWYVAPLLLLKAASGLYGQFLAVSGRGTLATLILLLVHWCVGLPATYLYAANVGGGVVALMQAHTAAWLTATLTFGVCYLGSSTLVSTSAGLGGLPATAGGVPVAGPVTQHPLGVPLLPRRDGGRA